MGILRGMRCTILLTLLVSLDLAACTAFKVTHDGRTVVGCNEDAWSINARVRFEQGRDGRYGAVYFGHFNGSPMRRMVDQIGMNEAGLMFDGLGIRQKTVAPVPGMPREHLSRLMPLVLQECADVPAAIAYLSAYDMGSFDHAMIFMVDRSGRYAVLQNDTIITGSEPTFAVTNWRIGADTDFDAIPVPRLQVGRALLAQQDTPSWSACGKVLQAMHVERERVANGTLFSTLFDLSQAQVDLTFYRDTAHVHRFDLATELAKGDRILDMAALFPRNERYESLQAYITPFHQRWLFWAMLGLAAIAAMACGLLALLGLRRLLARARGRAYGPLLVPWVLVVQGILMTGLIAVLLLHEEVYYFGLAGVSAALAWAPALLAILFLVGLRLQAGKDKWPPLVMNSALVLPFLGLLVYWHLLVP